MTNAEFYAEEIKNFKGTNFCNEFIKPIVRNGNCDGTYCHYCNIYVALWLMEEHKEPEVDWENVPVDTPILVRHSNEVQWDKRYFAKFENRRIHAFKNGYTSFIEKRTTIWKYAKLWEGSSEQAAEKEAQCTD